MPNTTPTHEWKTVSPRRFPDGEIFLITAIIEPDKIQWGLPAFLLEEFRDRVASLTIEELYDLNVQTRLATWIDKAVGFSLPIVRWRTAADYRYREGSVSIPEGDLAVWNKDYTPDHELKSQSREDRAFEVFNSQPYCAAVLQDRHIVAMCFCGEEGVISIFTRPAYRRNGYALSCLRLLTKKCSEAGMTLYFPTDVSNVASVHLAEKAGYKREGYVFWITIPPISKELLPARLQE